MLNKTVLMSDAKNFRIDSPINPYYHPGSIDLKKAAEEHNTIRELLIKAGVNVITVPSPLNCQDGVYTANWALVRGNTAVATNLPNARKSEEDYAKQILIDLGKNVVNVPDNLNFSGQGDALACGDLLFCGNNYRSDTEAQEFAANKLGYIQVQLQTVPEIDNTGNPVINSTTGWPDSFFYDIDLALAVIKPPVDDQKGLIAYCPEAFTLDSRELLDKLELVDKIHISIEEAKNSFAANLISTGDTVIMSARAPRLAKQLRERGLKVLTPDITELAKGGGYIRCVALTID